MDRPAKRQMQDSGLGWGQRELGKSRKCKRHVKERTDQALHMTGYGSSWERKGQYLFQPWAPVCWQWPFKLGKKEKRSGFVREGLALTLLLLSFREVPCDKNGVIQDSVGQEVLARNGDLGRTHLITLSECLFFWKRGKLPGWD